MSPITVAAPAKVNLFLRVLAREASGFHGIESLFQALDLRDTVRVAHRPDPGVTLAVAWGAPVPTEGGRRERSRGDQWPDDRSPDDQRPDAPEPDDLGPTEENLAYRAAVAYREWAGLEGEPGVDVTLTKVIPAGAGLGGGSSDAAAVLRAMDRIHGGALEREALMELAASLGSDVPFFLGPSPLALGWGRGERLLGLPPLESRPVVVAVPSFRIGTADAYGRLAQGRSGPSGSGAAPVPLTLEDLGSWSAVALRAGNDFEDVVLPSRPVAEDVLELLGSCGAAPRLLSGSGSALFGVFENGADADAAASRIESEAPGVRVLRTTTLEAWHEIVAS